MKKVRFFSDLVPLVKFPARHRREPQLLIVEPTSSLRKHSKVRTVVKRRRSSSPTTRKRCVGTDLIESGTCREIVSLESVQRHLVEEVDDRRLSRTGPCFNERTSVSVYEGCRTKEDQRSASRDFRLPEGWIVEQIPRRNSSHIDKYYIEPRTGKRFRSLVSVERYLNAVMNGTVASVSMVHSEQPPLLAITNDTGFETLFIDQNPPKKVKWVFTGPDGNMFSAYVSGSDVSSAVRQSWSEAYVALVQECY